MNFFRRMKKEGKISLNTKEKLEGGMDSILVDYHLAKLYESTSPPKTGMWQACKRKTRRIFKWVFPCFGKKEEEIATDEQGESEI